jgi:hypothetical protein
MEDTLAGIKAYFEATLAAELVAIGTERGVTVPPWKALDTCEVKDPQYPAIEIQPGAIEYDYGAEEAPLLEPAEHHQAFVEVTQAGSERKAVQEDLLRYAEGLRRITVEDESYGGRFNWVRLVRADFAGLPEAQGKGQILQKLRVELRVRIFR